MLTIAKFDRYDLVNTPGSEKPAFTIWFSGCSQQCPGCYNQRLWRRSETDMQTLESVIFATCRECKALDIDEIVLLGGEPMEQDVSDLTSLVRKLNQYGYKIWMYTSWEIDEIPDSIKNELYTIKCGRYDKTLKCDGIPSSSNQHFYRIKDGKWEIINLGGKS